MVSASDMGGLPVGQRGRSGRGRRRRAWRRAPRSARARRRPGRARRARSRTCAAPPSLGTPSVSRAGSASTRPVPDASRPAPRTPRRRRSTRSSRCSATRRLSSAGGALGDDPAAVDDGDPVGQAVGLLEVLRGEEDRHAVAPTSSVDDLPHRLAAARVEPGGRLVEEDHRRVADEARGEVEPAAHAAGVGGDAPAARRPSGRSARAARPRAPAPPRAAGRQAAHHPQVLGAGLQLVDAPRTGR